MDKETMLLALLTIYEKAETPEDARNATAALIEELGGGEDEEALPQDKSLMSPASLLYQIKAGFTGERTDRLGRRVCYNDGKRVPCSKPAAAPQAVKPRLVPPRVPPRAPAVRVEPKLPPSLPDKFVPPRPMGKSKAPRSADGRPITGYTASGLTNTAFGDMIESFSEQLGMRSILPEGRRSNRDVATEGSSLDVEYDHSGWAFEIKAVCVEATEYKAKPKKVEMQDKRRFAEMHGLKPAMMIIVTDVTKGEAHAYWREGIGAYALNPNNLTAWNYAGKITFAPGGKKEQ